LYAKPRSAPAEPRRDEEGRGDSAVDVHAQQARRTRVLGERADVASELRRADDVCERGHQQDREPDDEQAQTVHARVADLHHRLRQAAGRIACKVGPVPQLHEPDHDDREPETRDHRREGRRAAPAQRSERQAIEEDPEEAGHKERGDGRDGRRETERRHTEERDERAKHEDDRVREVQDVEDREDEREPDGEQRVDAADEDRVIELLRHGESG